MMKKFAFFLIAYIAIPLSLLEILAQYRLSAGFFEKKESFKLSPQEKQLVEAGLHKPLERIISTHRTIYGDPNIDKETLFATDKYGTIEPSTLTKASSSIDEYVLFCGGSTTESYVVRQARRVPDIFSSISGIGAINASRSGKDLTECIKTIKFVLGRFGKPRAIVIANNVNSLMNYPKKNFSDGEAQLKAQPPSLVDKAKANAKKFMPGIYTLISKIRHFNSYRPQIPDFQNLPEYEKQLAMGCCHGAASFNTRGGLPFDWDSATNRSQYFNHIRSLSQELKYTLELNFYPLDRVVFFMEPNSYALKGTSGSVDYRQLLHDVSGKKLNLETSSDYTSIFDKIYRSAIDVEGFKTLSMPSSSLRSRYFYDAVHLSPSGAYAVGEFYAKSLVDIH